MVNVDHACPYFRGYVVFYDPSTEEAAEETVEATVEETEKTIVVVVNGTPVTLTGKKSYIFVDIFERYEFDLTVSRGRAIITRLNGQDAQFASELNDGDEIELAWKEN